ncbi:hypothetical protein B9G69_013135 [Bdellovibrio sp. SKB1291214]|uniref:hypothetical protein n=1 Tax=Bdellovibrio sp. SKB1291214 TaxID=1732569 RepID=UPI000B51A98D|nr:hypothetical protein [Bdellovibrio sp. SKB1291214]UYL07988.1 hypothetical protein B9G69_013135 [Bdellovibrio sp. SKB1291214]
MKNMLLAFALLMTSTTAFAADFSKKMELCALQTSDDPEAYEKAFSETFIHVNKAQSLTAEQVRMINAHLIQVEYVTEPLSFQQIKALFTTGDQKYNDLYLVTMTSKTTGAVFIEAKSYPGDNPYGVVFTAAGELAAYNQDDNITLVDGQATLECPWK